MSYCVYFVLFYNGLFKAILIKIAIIDFPSYAVYDAGSRLSLFVGKHSQ